MADYILDFRFYVFNKDVCPSKTLPCFTCPYYIQNHLTLLPISYPFPPCYMHFHILMWVITHSKIMKQQFSSKIRYPDDIICSP